MMMDPAQLQQYYASLMQQWDPAAFAQNWSIPPPPTSVNKVKDYK